MDKLAFIIFIRRNQMQPKMYGSYILMLSDFENNIQNIEFAGCKKNLQDVPMKTKNKQTNKTQTTTTKNVTQIVHFSLSIFDEDFF